MKRAAASVRWKRGGCASTSRPRCGAPASPATAWRCAKCCAIWSTTRCATLPDGPVDIQATPVAGYRVALTVSDRGPGIADDEKEAVQQRFTRGRAGESLPGSGLGLAIVRSVAVAHGGSLWLQDRPGGGLSARVILPLARHHAGRRLAAWLGAACVAGLMLAGAPGDARAAGIPETVTRYPAPQPSARVLTIAGPTDTPVVAPLIQGFQSQRPDVNVVYREMGSRELYEAMIAGELKDVDVLMSSAADLQIRLANDGYAQRYARPTPPSCRRGRSGATRSTASPSSPPSSSTTPDATPRPRCRDRARTCCARWSATRTSCTAASAPTTSRPAAWAT